VESYSELPVNQSEVDAMHAATYTVGPLLTRATVQDSVGYTTEPSGSNMQATTSYSAATDSSDDIFGPSDCDTAPDDEVQLAASHSAVGTFAADARSRVGGRDSKQCPICGKTVIHLPRHLRSRSHKWTQEKAKCATSRFQLRKTYTYRNLHTAKTNQRKNSLGILVKRNIVSKDGHKPIKCPFSHCLAIIKRLSRHLITVHGIPKESHLLAKYINKARVMEKEDGSCNENTDERDELSVTGPLQEQHQLAESMFGDSDCDDVNAVGEHEDIEPNEDTEPNEDALLKQHSDLQVECDKFQKWLTSADGGLVDIKSAQQHVRQIKNIIGQANGEQHMADLLLDKSHISDVFLGEYTVQRQYQPGTVRSHLSSLCHLYDFWLLTSPDYRKHEVTVMKQTIKRWMTSYKKSANQRRTEKQDIDLAKIITADDVTRFNGSQVAQEALKILRAASEHAVTTITKQEYTTVRDYLLCAMILRNANRPGVLSSVTRDQVLQAKNINDQYVVSVSRHKTSAFHGPAKLVLTKGLHKWLMVFVRKILPIIPADSDSKLMFTSWTGEPIDNIGRCFQTTMRRAGLHDITCTLFRKSAVSKIHQIHPGEKANLADLMCHRQETATKWYRMVDKDQTSVHAAAKLAEVMNNTEEVEPSSDSEELDKTSNTALKNPSSDSVAEAPHLMQRKKLFTARELRTLTTCCHDIIHGGSMSKEKITAALSVQKQGLEILKHYSMVQLITRLTYERRKTKLM